MTKPIGAAPPWPNAGAMFSSDSQVWETPPEFFAALDREFAFTLDVCALPHNAKCSRYFSPSDDGLAQSWVGETCWMNPPFGREIGKWMKKAHEECLRGATVVALVPARVDARWWRRYCTKAAEIRFLEGRLKFIPGELDAPVYSAPFPAAIVVFRPGTQRRGVTIWASKCNGCGLAVLRRPNARYCSNACRQRAFRRRKLDVGAGA